MLPYELLGPIFSHPDLSQDDRKALRLTCRTVDEPAGAALFNRIVLSRLYKKNKILKIYHYFPWDWVRRGPQRDTPIAKKSLLAVQRGADA